MDKETRLKIEKTIRDITQLPTLPTICTTINEMMANPKTNSQDLSKVIEEDSALVSKVLRVVNSAFFGLPKKISTLPHAIVILGFNEIRHIIYSISVINLFGKSGEDILFDHKAFWQHSLGVGVCAKVIADKMDQDIFELPEEAFIAGLIHDIGKIVEDQYIHEDFVKTLELRNEKKTSLLEAENKVLGYNHQHVGYYLADRWNLPKNLTDVIRFHNRVDKTVCSQESFPLVSVVHIANTLTRALEIGSGGDDLVPIINRDCWEVTKLTEYDIEPIMEETEFAFKELEQLLLN